MNGLFLNVLVRIVSLAANIIFLPNKFVITEETRVEGPWVLGTAPNPGSRTDLASLKTDCDDGKPLSYLWSQHFKTMVKYHKAIQCYRRQKVKARDFKSELAWLWGLSGQGKSTAAKKLALRHGSSVFVKTNSTGEWWDTYMGEDIVIFDDFNASMLKYTSLMQMVGNDYPLPLGVKGDFVHFRAKLVIFTSIRHPEDVYKPGLWHHGLARRCAGNTYYCSNFKVFRRDDRSPMTLQEEAGTVPESW